MRTLVGSFILCLVACAASSQPQPIASASRASASSKPPPPPVASSCAPTYAESKAQQLACDATSPACTYAEGKCACMSECLGGPIPPPDYRAPMRWECAPKVCTTSIKEGAACKGEGTHCGRCYGQLWDCKNGKWVGSEAPVPP